VRHFIVLSAFSLADYTAGSFVTYEHPLKSPLLVAFGLNYKVGRATVRVTDHWKNWDRCDPTGI
jgi:hypothetical protein